MEIITIHACPHNCENATFTTTAHIMQDWEVTAEGEFIGVATDCLEVTHRPDNDNIWTCNGCGAEAEAITCVKRYMSDGSVLYTEHARLDGQEPRAFFVGLGKEGLNPAKVLKDDAGYYVVWCGGRIDI